MILTFLNFLGVVAWLHEVFFFHLDVDYGNNSVSCQKCTKGRIWHVMTLYCSVIIIFFSLPFFFPEPESIMVRRSSQVYRASTRLSTVSNLQQHDLYTMMLFGKQAPHTLSVWLSFWLSRPYPTLHSPCWRNRTFVTLQDVTWHLYISSFFF